MENHKFKVTRELHGDKIYQDGDTRTAAVADVGHLIRSGALVPDGEAATKAAVALLGPQDTWGAPVAQLHGAPVTKEAVTNLNKADLAAGAPGTGATGVNGGAAHETFGGDPAVAGGEGGGVVLNTAQGQGSAPTPSPAPVAPTPAPAPAPAAPKAAATKAATGAPTKKR